MNTKIKIGIAAAIVAALVALIALDRNTAPSTPPPGGTGETPAAGPSGRSEDTETLQLSEKFQKIFRTVSPSPPVPVKGGESAPGKEIRTPSPAQPEEYVIQEKDTYAEIARKKYGDPGLWELIAKANPSVKPTALRPGRKIVIPAPPDARPAPAENTLPSREPAASSAPAPSPAPASLPTVYEVVAGDTLSGISKKIYNTTRHARALYEANRDQIENPNDLRAGLKLRLPEGLTRQENVVPAVAPPAPPSAPVPSSAGPAAEPAGGRIHTVAPGESLWKIAEKYCGDRGILEFMQSIIRANPDRLKDEKTMLRVGWNLVIPD